MARTPKGQNEPQQDPGPGGGLPPAPTGAQGATGSPAVTGPTGTAAPSSSDVTPPATEGAGDPAPSSVKEGDDEKKVQAASEDDSVTTPLAGPSATTEPSSAASDSKGTAVATQPAADSPKKPIVKVTVSSKGANGMAQSYLSPGVYVEEIPSSVKPIVGVGTSTAAFVGFFRDGIEIPEPNPDFDPNSADPKFRDPVRRFKFGGDVPADVTGARAALDKARGDLQKAPDRRELAAAVRDARTNYDIASRQHEIAAFAAKPGDLKLCTSFSDFKKYFGDFSLDPDQRNLAQGVYGFFNNGGSRCFVLRYATLDLLQAADGFSPLEAVTEIAIVAAPGITDDVVQENLIDHCENMGNRFAVLDPPEAIADDQLTKPNIQGNVRDTDYGAYYFPRIKVFDLPSKLINPDPNNKGEIYVGPSGHVAGVYARVDNTRGVHKAPANEVIRGALGVRYPITKAIQDGLNPDGVNCIRDMNGDIRIWGARTVGGDNNFDFKYINVRRLFLFLRESIDRGTQWVVFEPNDRNLWARISLNVTAFLTNVWHDGALFGSTPAEAFYVKCDDETNPPEVRDLGRVVTEIGVAVVKPAEFVIFRISQWAGPQKT